MEGKYKSRSAEARQPNSDSRRGREKHEGEKMKFPFPPFIIRSRPRNENEEIIISKIWSWREDNLPSVLNMLRTEIDFFLTFLFPNFKLSLLGRNSEFEGRGSLKSKIENGKVLIYTFKLPFKIVTVHHYFSSVF